MSDPTKFPQMHIAESAMNRIMNMKAELLPLTNLTVPTGDDSGPSAQQIGDLANTAQDTSVAPSAPGVEGAAIDDQLAMGTTGAAGGAPAAAAGGDVAAAGGTAALGAGAAGGATAAGGAAIAGEAVASGAELLPLLLV